MVKIFHRGVSQYYELDKNLKFKNMEHEWRK